MIEIEAITTDAGKALVELREEVPTELSYQRLETVLVVEDHASLNRALAIRLEKAGLNVASAYDGIGALDKVRCLDPDLIILDLALPRMHGYKLLHALRNEANLLDAPVLVVTADPDPRLEERARRRGVTRVFRKPVDQRELVQTVLDTLAGLDQQPAARPSGAPGSPVRESAGHARARPSSRGASSSKGLSGTLAHGCPFRTSVWGAVLLAEAQVSPLGAPPRHLVAAIVLWLVAVGASFAALLVYSNTPGQALHAPERWPRVEGLSHETDRCTLLMFAHPRCSCTLASLHELERLVAQVGGRLGGYVLFFRPSDQGDAWAQTALRSAAETIPGVRVLDDVDGAWARHFGARTSGHVVVYDAAGRLAFSGGITSARAHEGDNRGRDAIRYFVNEGEVLEAVAPVFGCDLLDESCPECEEMRGP